MASIEYVTEQGQRWCDIAYIAYGDAGRISELSEANPNYPLNAVFDSGITILLPVIESEDVSTALLPPWKR